MLLLLATLAGGGWVWATRERPLEVEIAAVAERPQGTQAAVLNASGYVTARRRATVSSVSPKYWRRSEWPTIAPAAPSSSSIGAEISPV